MQNTVEHVEENPSESEGLIKTPRQLIVTVILAFVIPIVSIILLVKLVEITSPMGAGARAQTSEAIAQRIQPVASFKLVDVDAPVESKTGQQVYESTCAACHSTGVAGAPKLGDNAAWAPLIETGFDELVNVAIHGIRAMPPRGGNPSLSDLEVARAVAYIANNSGGSFEEPAEGDEAAAGGEAEGDDAATAQAPAASAQATAGQAADSTAAAPEQPAQTQTQDQSGAEPAAQQQQADAGAAAADETPAAAAPAEAPATDQSQDSGSTDAAPAQDQQQAAAGSAELDPAGEKLYNAVCFACHTTGVANAPKIGDKAAWAPYIETGFDAMLQNAIHGVGAMPPRGGSQASDEEMKAALEYILSTVQ